MKNSNLSLKFDLLLRPLNYLICLVQNVNVLQLLTLYINSNVHPVTNAMSDLRLAISTRELKNIYLRTNIHMFSNILVRMLNAKQNVTKQISQ